MNNEAFLALVRAGLWEGCEPVSGEGLAVSGKDVLRLAEEQSVVGLVAAGAEWFTVNGSRCMIPLTEKLTLLGRCQLIEQRNEAMNRFIAWLVTRMQDAGIKMVLVKGQGVAQCYEKPLWREAGDIDFMLDEENYRNAKVLLAPQATHVETEDKSRLHQGMKFEPWTVELHGTMHSDFSKRMNKGIDEVQECVFNRGGVRKWNNNGIEISLPSADNDIVIVFTHFLQHFYFGGIGLRQVCDWCRLLFKYKYEIDRELLGKRIKSMGLMEEWRAFASLAVEWLNMPKESMPFYEKTVKNSRRANSVLKLIFETGDLGHNTDESYRTRYPYFVHKSITLWKRLKGYFRRVIISPGNATSFFVSYVFNHVKASLR